MSVHLDRAVPGSGVDSAVAWHYGDPLREQRLLATRAGVVDRSNRDVLHVGGPDRLGWLHSICSQHLSGLADGDSTQALVLSPHGHVEQHWQLSELDGTVWLDTEPGAAPTVLDYLVKMRFLKRVEPVDVGAEWGVLSLGGPQADAVLSAAGLPVPAPGRAVSLRDSGLPGGLVRRLDPSGPADPSGTVDPSGPVDLIVPRDALAATVARLVEAGAAAVGSWAHEALRVQARTPRLGFETDHRTIPHEVGWIGTALHLDKGCYRGQETVARVHNLGRPPRRLVLLHLSGESDELPAPGTPVELAGRPVGFVGTAVHHYELGPVALAVVKRSATDGLTVAGAPVGVEE